MDVVNKQCIVLFPVYRSITKQEASYFKQAVSMTDGYKKVFIAPQSFLLDASFVSPLSNIEVVRFPDHFFADIEGYNRLMLSIDFYARFKDYEYILIHQSDAYLFSSDLKYWCNKGYDYIGAPWFKPHKLLKTRIYRFLLKYLPFLYSEKASRRHQLYNNVGNGGLSLRKVSSFLNVLNSISPDIVRKYIEIQQTDYNEDVFWGIEAPRFDEKFKKPDWKEALTFSFEEYPSIAYKMNGNKLPFGCHAFNVHETDFWSKFIPNIK